MRRAAQHTANNNTSTLHLHQQHIYMEDLLVLDSAIRNWVLVPIVAVMFIVAILRSNITRLMQEDKKSDLKAIQQR